METINLKNLKMWSEKEINEEQAKELLRRTESEYDFSIATENTEEEIGFEIRQNRSYFVRKIGKKGSILYPGSMFEHKAKTGIFEVIMKWDYRHPSNFCLNRNNCEESFEFTE